MSDLDAHSTFSASAPSLASQHTLPKAPRRHVAGRIYTLPGPWQARVPSTAVSYFHNAPRQDGVLANERDYLVRIVPNALVVQVVGVGDDVPRLVVDDPAEPVILVDHKWVVVFQFDPCGASVGTNGKGRNAP